jgi:hypothetical protein
MTAFRRGWDRWRLWLGLWAVTALPLIALDFFLRVHVPRDDELRAFTAPSSAKLTPAVTLDDVRQRLETWFPAPVVAQTVERTIILQAVFATGGQSSALLAATGPNGQVERVRAPVGHVIDEWVVETIEPKRVVLKRGEERRELVMFGSRP